MAVYVDTPFKVDPREFPDAPRVFKNAMSAHLMADTEEELRTYAKKIGLSLRWIQKSGTIRCHFDITGKFLALVERDESVLKLTPKEMAVRYMAKANASSQSTQVTS